MSKRSVVLGILVALSAVGTAIADVPTITVTALDPQASEADADTATFLLTREGGDETQPLVVPIRVSGSTTPGRDYVPPESSVTFPAQVSIAIVTVKLLRDAVGEDTETLVLSVPEETGVLSAERQAEVTVLDASRADPKALNGQSRDVSVGEWSTNHFADSDFRESRGPL